jgi:ankyrin repeat protein
LILVNSFSVSRVPILLAEPDKYGMTPLGYACMHGNEEALQTIFTVFRGSLEHRDKRDRSYLQLAAASPNPAPCVALLLANGANPCSCDAKGRTPLHTALLRKKAEAALVSALTVNNSSAKLTDLLDKQDSLGNTALHYAVKNGLADAARVLLSKGASILPDNEGITPFHIAISRRDIEACTVRLPTPLQPFSGTDELL